MTRVLVTAATHPTGRNCIRALLKEDDIEVVAGDSREEALARLPFEVAKAKLPSPEDPNFADATKRICIANDIEVVLPCLDSITLALARQKAEFARMGVSAPVPEYDVARRAVDKQQLTEFASAIGLPYARSICIMSIADIEKIESLTYPIIVKPKIGHGARGVRVYKEPPADWHELKKTVRKGHVVAQEYIPGGTGSIFACGYVFDHQHRVKCAFQSRSTRTQFDFGGPALAGVSLRNPLLCSYGEALIRAIGPWVGIALLEFKRHADTGDFYILDFNPRIWGYSSLAEDAGISFPFASVLVAKDKPFRTHVNYITDVCMERQELLDHSNYVFSCGRRVDLPRPASRWPERRAVALFTSDEDTNAISAAVDDKKINAVLVLTNSSMEMRAGKRHEEKLFFWSPPSHLPRGELPYWAGHLLGATEVTVIDWETTRTHSWRALKQAWWFGSESDTTP